MAKKPTPTAIVMKATSAGPNGNLLGGKRYRIGEDVSVEEAKDLVDGHYAEYVEPAAAKPDAPLETADEAGGDETTAER